MSRLHTTEKPLSSWSREACPGLHDHQEQAHGAKSSNILRRPQRSTIGTELVPSMRSPKCTPSIHHLLSTSLRGSPGHLLFVLFFMILLFHLANLRNLAYFNNNFDIDTLVIKPLLLCEDLLSGQQTLAFFEAFRVE
jgi:hypothetical protein